VRLSRETGEREFALMKWGLVPGWSKTPKTTFSSINARADNLETGGAWREPFKRRRCLIPAEFFYECEPKNPEAPKAPTQPWAVALRDDRLFSFGGIWDWWKDKTTGAALESFAIVTVDPNEVLGPFHNRCPLIIEPKDYDRWMTLYVKEDPSTVPVELVRRYPAEGMRAWKVNPLKGNEPELLEPLTAPAGPPLLF
jgi:putative SOS response-associated peptidase YedK